MSVKKLKVSRNRKKTWKKHSKATDVEEYLEEERFNERIGGAIADKADESLFCIEKTGTDVNDIETEAKSKEVEPKKSSKLKDLASDLKCFKILEPQSKVSPMTARIGTKNKKRNFLNDDQKFAKVWPQKRLQYMKAKDALEYKTRAKDDPNVRFQMYDLWDDKPNPDQLDDEMEELKDYEMILKGSKPPKVSKYRYQKPSLLPSVEVPHSGQSYNPTFEDHQNLLATAHDIEVNKIKAENRIKRNVEDYYVSKSNAPNDKTWAQEMSRGLGLSDEEVSDTEDNSEVVTTARVIRPDKKTRAQKRKELLRKKLESQKKLEKNLKSKANEVFKLKTLKKEIETNEKKSIERQKRRSQRLVDRLYGPQRLSRYNYEAPDLELQLSQELTGSLRSLKTEGNLLEDRFKSLQRRNVIESRTKQTFKRKYKLKKINKSTSKQDVD